MKFVIIKNVLISLYSSEYTVLRMLRPTFGCVRDDNRVCVCVCVCVLSLFSRVPYFVTLQTVAHQPPLSMEFSRQEHFPTQGSNMCLLSFSHYRQILYHWASVEALGMMISCKWTFICKYRVKTDVAKFPN